MGSERRRKILIILGIIALIIFGFVLGASANTLTSQEISSGVGTVGVSTGAAIGTSYFNGKRLIENSEKTHETRLIALEDKIKDLDDRVSNIEFFLVKTATGFTPPRMIRKPSP